jgi:hypothetical protein
MAGRGAEYEGFLEDQVHRLNVELARHQHHGTLTATGSLHSTPPPLDSLPPFLVDDDNLPPLIRAYDDQVSVDPPAAAAAACCDHSRMLVKPATLVLPSALYFRFSCLCCTSCIFRPNLSPCVGTVYLGPHDMALSEGVRVHGERRMSPLC